jgi:hypothetical protein
MMVTMKCSPSLVLEQHQTSVKSANCRLIAFPGEFILLRELQPLDRKECGQKVQEKLFSLLSRPQFQYDAVN